MTISTDINDGVVHATVETTEDLLSLSNGKHFASKCQLVFRGQRDPTWNLMPTLYRILQEAMPASEAKDIKFQKRVDVAAAGHLRQFLKCLRGDRVFSERFATVMRAFPIDSRAAFGLEDLGKRLADDYVICHEIWSLGQHYGLFTPLLDWTYSVNHALFFAYEQPATNPKKAPKYRILWALDTDAVRDKNSSLRGLYPTQVIDVVEPATGLNIRLLSQEGLFTLTRWQGCLSGLIRENFPGHSKPILIKIYLPDEQRHECLLRLRENGIHAKSVYADYGGITRYTNDKLLRQLDNIPH